jgi:hypothetical protein
MQRIALGVVLLAIAVHGQSRPGYLSWSRTQCEATVRAYQIDGSVGSRWRARGLKTEESFYYKLRATWITPEVIRATARFHQLQNGLSDSDTEKLVNEAEEAADTVIIVDLDPNEGSGVIPSDWSAFLTDRTGKSSVGSNSPQLRHIRALNGLFKRNYDYDRFWMAFALVDTEGKPLLDTGSEGFELTVRVQTQRETIRFRVPASLAERQRALAAKRSGEN